MKLSEFSSIYKVTERHARRLIQKHETDMAGHYEKHGNEGTFIDDVGVEILKSKLRATFEVTTESASERERQLESALTEMSMRYAAACEKLVENAGAVALLEAAKERSIALEARAENAEAGRLEAIREAEDLRRAAQIREAAAAEAERRCCSPGSRASKGCSCRSAGEARFDRSIKGVQTSKTFKGASEGSRWKGTFAPGVY